MPSAADIRDRHRRPCVAAESASYKQARAALRSTSPRDFVLLRRVSVVRVGDVDCIMLCFRSVQHDR